MRKLETIQEVIFAFEKVHNFNDLIYWYSILSTPFQVWFALGALGICVVIYIFVVAFFVDKHQ